MVCLNTSRWSQTLVGISVTLLMIQMGGFFGWSSPYIARLTNPSTQSLYLTTDEASWITALLQFGRIVGAFIGAIFVYLWGSKTATVLSFLPIALSWILMYLSTTSVLLYASRISGGFGLGVAFSCWPLFVGEVSRPINRGAIVSIAFIGSPFASVAASILGYYLTFHMFSIVFLVPCLIGLFTLMFLPSSPHYLIQKGQLEEAKKSLIWYRNGDDSIDKELDEIYRYVTSSNSLSFKDKLKQFNAPYNRKVLFIVLMLFVFMQCTGLNSVLFYTETILEKGKFNLINRSLAVTLVNLIGAFCSIINALLIDKIGRRLLLLISSNGITIPLIALGTHFLLIKNGYDVSNIEWLPFVSELLFNAFYVIGLPSIPSTVMSEVFPSNIKTVAACIASVISALSGFISCKSYQPLVDLLGESFVFYSHAFIAILVIPFVIFLMPETKGKSLQQIQEEFSTK